MNQAGSVKSAQRVVAILRDFAEKRRAQRAAEVARAIDAPISSCVALLSTLVGQGVLFYDEMNRSYIPTAALRDLTDWLVDQNPLEKQAIYFARRLNRELGTPTAVTRRSGLYLEWLYTLGVRTMAAGDFRPLCKTINGRAVLSTMPDSEIAELVAAHNERFGREDYIEPSVITERARAARYAGYASGLTSLVPGFAAICFPIKDDDCGEEVLLTVQLPACDLGRREHRVVETARRMIPWLAAHSMGRTHVGNANRHM